MPTAPKRPCSKPNCPELTDDRFCEAHAKQSNPDRWRGSPESRGYGSDWKKVRLKALERDAFLCQVCLTGRVKVLTPAKDVHHIIPIADDPSKRLDLKNLLSVCRPCHKQMEPSNYRKG